MGLVFMHSFKRMDGLLAVCKQGCAIFCDVCVGTYTSAPKVVTGPGYQAHMHTFNVSKWDGLDREEPQTNMY